MNIIVFFAHPDDETMLCGGTMALLAQAGAQVHYLCATRGEGGETGEPPLCTRAELGAWREQEMICAVEALGGSSLTFLGYIDPTVGPEDELYPYTDDPARLAELVATHIQQINAEVVITHGSNGEYGHPAHRLTHQVVRMAVESLATHPAEIIKPLLYTVQANYPHHPRPRLANKDDPAHLILDVTPVLSQKEKAAMCHRTQHALFVRRPSRETGRPMTVPEVLLRLESLHRVFPPVVSVVNDPLADLLRPYSDGKPGGVSLAGG